MSLNQAYVQEEKIRAMEFTKRNLVMQDSVWRKECLKKRAYEDHQKLSTRSWCHQHLKIIRSWSSSESEDWKPQLVKCCYSNTYDFRRNGSLEQRLFKRN